MSTDKGCGQREESFGEEKESCGEWLADTAILTSRIAVRGHEKAVDAALALAVWHHGASTNLFFYDSSTKVFFGDPVRQNGHRTCGFLSFSLGAGCCLLCLVSF